MSCSICWIRSWVRAQRVLTVRAPDGQTPTVLLSVPDPAARRHLTEPSMLLSGLGFRFREPPVPPVSD